MIGLMSIFLRKTPLFILAVAFLTMQWANAHIHLAEHHSHDGSHHQHFVEAHSHHLTSHHDSIDSEHQLDHLSIIELDQLCGVSAQKKLCDYTAFIIASEFEIYAYRSRINQILVPQTNTKLSYLSQTAVRLRAPPAIS